MTRFRQARLLLLGLTLVAATAIVRAGQTPATASPQAAASPQTAALTAELPVAPDLAAGRFDNGLRYFVRTNHKPEQRAELRLVVNAGSILEDDDQQGLAHFVEHMAFNGTAHFPKQDVVTFMQSIGMQFGAHVNAYTSFDETVYMLQVPTDKPDVLDRALLILEDWAHNVTFDPVEIDKERGVIMEEWRLGRGAATRMQDKQFPVLLKGSRYAERIPIGKPEIIQNFKPAQLTRFYHDWYRPDLMSVVAVGDFDQTAVVKEIQQHFASIPVPPNPRPRPAYDVPDQPGTDYAIATDKEAAQTTVSVYHKEPVRDPRTVGAYRQQIVEGLFESMLSARFSEMSQQPDAPFLGAGPGRGLFVRTREVSTLSALVKDDGVEQGLDALFTEAERVARFGFTATELDRQKQNVMRSLDQLVAEKDNQPSGQLADELVRHVTDREPVPGIVYEHALYARFLPGITLAEVNQLAKGWVPDGNRVVLVSGPDKPGVTMPSEQALAAVMKAVANKPLTAYVDTVDAQPLLDRVPEPGRVVDTSTKDAYGITEWTLSNGVHVVLKPTTFKEDEILFRATGPGGTSLASDADFIPAATASQVVGTGGLGAFSAVDLRKALTGKVASARASIGDTDEVVSGSASRKDLETMFQLIYMTFTEPRKDPTIFGVLTSQMKTILANRSASPEYAFGVALQSAMTQDHPRARPMTPELVDRMNLDQSFAFYTDRFADASAFTFVFVGSFDLPAVKPLVERYLGSLPATHRNESWKDIGMRPPGDVVVRKVEKGIEPKSEAAIVFNGPFDYNQTQRVAIRALANVLENRLREKLREDLGGTYSVSASASYDKIPVPDYSVAVEFGCAPDRLDELVRTVFSEIEGLKAKGPTEAEVGDVKAAFNRDFETSSRQNGWLVNQISLRYEYGEELDSLFHITDYYSALTADAIQDAAKRYLDTNRYVQVTLVPEKK